MQDWAAAFDAPVHLHAADRRWIVRPDPAIRLWDGDACRSCPASRWCGSAATSPAARCCTGRRARTAPARSSPATSSRSRPGAHRVSFLWSYPNMMPLPAATVRRLLARLAPWRYQRIYGAFAGQDVLGDARTIVARSGARYCALVEGADPA